MKAPLRFCLALMAAALATSASLSAAPVLLNGSFEDPTIQGGTVAGGGTNWTASSSSGVFIVSNAAGFGQTPYGNQYLALNPGNSNAQDIGGFEAGVNYTVYISFADLLGGTTPTLTVTLSGKVSLSRTFLAPVGGPYPGTIPFTTASFSFVPATSGNVTLTLLNTNSGGALAVDNAMLVVPEPSSIIIVALGLISVAHFSGRFRTGRRAEAGVV